MRRLLAAIAILAAAVACGGGDDVSPADDRAAAQGAIAAFEDQLEDDGFEASPPDDEEDEELEFQSEECEEFARALPDDDDELPGETASADSDDFERGALDTSGGVQEGANASVGFVEESGDLEEFFELLEDERLPECLGEAMEEALSSSPGPDEPPIQLGDVDVETETSDAGDQGAAFVIETTAEVDGFEFPIVFEFEFVRVDRAAAFVFVSAVGSDDPIDRDDLVELLVEELEDA